MGEGRSASTIDSTAALRDNIGCFTAGLGSGSTNVGHTNILMRSRFMWRFQIRLSRRRVVR